MSVVKGQSEGTHHTSADQCSGAERSTASTQLKSEPSTSSGDMGGEHKFPRSSREMRNMAEKMRRDKLNSHITELAEIVPLCSGSNKRLDKTSTLRLAANFISMHKILMKEEDGAEKVPSGLGGIIAHNLAEVVGGFLLVVTSTGKIIYVTEAIEQFLGHSQVDLLGQSIYNVIYPDDQKIFQQHLIPGDKSRVSFYCRMMEKALTRNDPGRYEIIHVVGQLKPIPPSPNTTPASPSTSAMSPGARSNSENEENYESDGDADNQTLKAAVNRMGTHMLISFVRIVKDLPVTSITWVESTLDEYITRHGLTGNILYTDHRISSITGLMPTDVIGKSAFSYMHPDDRVWSIVAQKLMFTSTQGQGDVSYRLRCCGGTLVTLRSRGYLEVDKQTGQVESFVCINTLISAKEADDEIKNQRRKLLPIISSEDCDDHLKTISNTLPPELLKDVLPLLTPEALQNLAKSFQISEMKDDKITECSSVDTTRQSKQNCEASIDVLNKSEERRNEPCPYQRKAKKLCNSERFDSSPEPCTIKASETEEYMRKSPANDSWHSTSRKQAPASDFNTVVTKNFSFGKEHCRQTQAQSDQQFNPAVSPQAQVYAAFQSQYENENCYQPPVDQYSGTSYTDQESVKSHGINSYQQNTSPTVPAAGGHSPLGNGDEVILGMASFSVDDSMPLVENQKNEEFSSEILNQMTASPSFCKPKCSPALSEDINTRNLYKQRESQNISGNMTSPGGNYMNRSETNMSPSVTYPFHAANGDVLLTESPEDSGVSVSSYASPQELKDPSSISSAVLSSPAVSPGCHNFQQAECDGSTNSRNQSGSPHQGHNILYQHSPNSMLGIRDPYHCQQQQHMQQYQNHQQQPQQQQQLLLQQQQQQQQQKQLLLQQQQQLLLQQQEQQKQLLLQQQKQQQQTPALQHYHSQSAITAASIQHSFTVTSPKFELEGKGQLSNQISASNGPLTNWQTRGSGIPCHSAVASENRNVPDQPESCYRHCTPSPQGIVQSHLSTQYSPANKSCNTHFQYSPSQSEVEGKFL